MRLKCGYTLKILRHSSGTITTLELPTGEGVRHECGVESGSVVTPFYDPMISKWCGEKRERLPVRD